MRNIKNLEQFGLSVNKSQYARKRYENFTEEEKTKRECDILVEYKKRCYEMQKRKTIVINIIFFLFEQIAYLHIELTKKLRS